MDKKNTENFVLGIFLAPLAGFKPTIHVRDYKSLSALATNNTLYYLLDSSRPPCDSRQFFACDSAFVSQLNYLLEYKKKKHRLMLLFLARMTGFEPT